MILFFSSLLHTRTHAHALPSHSWSSSWSTVGPGRRGCGVQWYPAVLDDAPGCQQHWQLRHQVTVSQCILFELCVQHFLLIAERLCTWKTKKRGLLLLCLMWMLKWQNLNLRPAGTRRCVLTLTRPSQRWTSTWIFRRRCWHSLRQARLTISRYNVWFTIYSQSWNNCLAELFLLFFENSSKPTEPESTTPPHQK